MAGPQRYVKGRLVSWADLKLRIRGTSLVDDPIDFTGLDWDQEVERELPQGPGQGIAGKSSGSYKCSGTLELRYASSVTLQGKLQAASPSGKICDMDFDVFGDFQWEGDDTVYTVELRDCSLDQSTGSAKPGPEALKKTHKLNPRKVFDPYCLIGED